MVIDTSAIIAFFSKSVSAETNGIFKVKEEAAIHYGFPSGKLSRPSPISGYRYISTG